MKTILEIQKLDRQIRALMREVDKCPASVNYKHYKKLMQDGKVMYQQLDTQANDIIKHYNKAVSKLEKCQGQSEIIKKRNTPSINLENTTALVADTNGLVAELSEENRRIEELVRKAEETVRKITEISGKLQEIKKRQEILKVQIAKKQQEVAPKIAEIEKRIKELEPTVKDKEKFDTYHAMKEKGIFPVYVDLADNNFCDGCKVELSLNFIEKLKTHKMLNCEHCNRIIMMK